ncbi:cytochrome b/b6 domain-containing protein [Phenylobacterium sp. J367]|uniref:cytochrome b/b6 domain-containing protein n=1 Tax=Phenylobacterium sp. J367 TaxID=2898435 RepID=UPI0021512BB2|nr:cytochrome b/b6 domain-containing protein [Phenylobacterium sp. J367]MCR5878265.1 cytochrome b/b6 domain-containing protein [Phenylobacterium sp. J367]
MTKELYRRHSVLVRLTHWLGVLAVSLLLMSGLQIFNAHPALYWGQKSTFREPWLVMGMVERGGQPVGVTQIGDTVFETTGVLGYSGAAGKREPRGFPAWATVPSYRDLASGRRWHFFFAWLFVINGLVYLAWGLIGGHLRRDLLPTKDQWRPRHLWREAADHARLRFPKGEAARSYNAIQKLTYLLMILIVLPLMLLTGLSMSPGFNATAPWLIDLFGGRQSARSIHFICAGLIVLFVIVHVALVVLSGFWNNMRSMITGFYAVDTSRDRP